MYEHTIDIADFDAVEEFAASISEVDVMGVLSEGFDLRRAGRFRSFCI